MWGMLDHVANATSLFLQDGTKMTLVVFSLIAAVVLLLLSRNLALSAKTRSVLMHSHLAFLLFPLVFFATTLSCQQVGLCEVSLAQTLLFVIPVSITLGLIFGLLIVPFLHRWRAQPENNHWQKFVNTHAEKLNMRKPPDVFVVDSGQIEAYSTGGFKPAIFVTVGMLESLTTRQMQAVLLHELAHIREGSHALKPITLLLRAFYPEPIVTPAAMIAEEERKADAFAAKVQKTDAYLKAAKRKTAE